MTMTAGIINGTDLLIYIGGTKIYHSTNHSLNLGMSPRDATTKDSAAWKALLGGLRNWSISGDALMAMDAAYGYSELQAVLIARTAVTVKFSSEVAGDYYWSGSALLTVLDLEAGTEDNASMSYTLEGTGALTQYTGT